MAAAVGPPDEGEAARLAPKVMVESLLQAAYDKAAKSFVHRQMPFTEVKVQGGLTAGQVDAEEWEINDGSGSLPMQLPKGLRAEPGFLSLWTGRPIVGAHAMARAAGLLARCEGHGGHARLATDPSLLSSLVGSQAFGTLKKDKTLPQGRVLKVSKLLFLGNTFGDAQRELWTEEVKELWDCVIAPAAASAQPGS